MKTLTLIFSFILLFALNASAQNDIQTLQVQINELKAKPIENLTPDDIRYLENVIGMSSQYYGVTYQKIVDAQKTTAKSILQKFHIWQTEKSRAEDLDVKLGTEKLKTAAQEEVIKAQEDTIITQRELIQKLQNELDKLRKEISKTNLANRKLKDEKVKLEEIMNDNLAIVKRVTSLLSDDDNLKAEAPPEMKKQLEDAECEIAELVVNNYLLTIEKLKNDPEYLNTVQEFYKENSAYPDEFYQYIVDGEMLIFKFEQSETACVKQKTSEIKAAIEELKSLIQQKDCDFFCVVSKFIIDNILLLGIIFLLLIGIILVLVLKK